MISRASHAGGAAAYALIVFALASAAPAYEVFDHGSMALNATAASSVDSRLREDLLWSDGVQTRLRLDETSRDRTVQAWISEGAQREDDSTRSVNHFHNPLRRWDEAGLRVTLPFFSFLGFTTGPSSVLWQQQDQ